MSFTEQSIKLVVPTRKLVTEWSNVLGMDGERVLKTNRVKYLLKEFEEGRYRIGSIDFSRRTFANNELRRVNGQHTLALLQLLGDSDLKKAKQIVSVYNTYSPESEADLHNSFDNKMNVRGVNDEIRIAAMSADKEFGNYPKNFVQTLVRAMNYVNAGYRNPTRNHSPQRILFVPEYAEFLRWAYLLAEKQMGEAMESIYRSWASRAVAKTYFIHPTNRDIALEFWRGILVGSPNPEHAFSKGRSLVLTRQKDTNAANKFRMFGFIDEILDLYVSYCSEKETNQVTEFEFDEDEEAV